MPGRKYIRVALHQPFYQKIYIYILTFVRSRHEAHQKFRLSFSSSPIFASLSELSLPQTLHGFKIMFHNSKKASA